MSVRTLIVVHPRNAATGVAKPVRFGGGGTAPLYHDGQHYRAGVVRSPRFSARLSFDQSGWTGGTLPSTGTIVFAPAEASLIVELASLYWKGAAIAVETGPETGPFTARLTGTVADMAVAGGKLVLTIADLSSGIDKALLTARFAGTGGIEGIAEAAGRLKRRSWGQVFNVEGRILDKANNIYEFGDPARPLFAFIALRDKGSAGGMVGLPWQGSIAATFTALQAATAPAGGGVVAPSIACAKWWTQPAGPLTADLGGEHDGDYVEGVVSIAGRILTAVGGPIILDAATAQAWRPGVAGIHIADENETAAQAIDRLLLGASLLWVLDPTGSIAIRQISFADPNETMRPITSSRAQQLPPTRSRRAGYRKNHRQHADGEIAAVLRGSDVTYSDGTPIEALKPQEAAANVTETRNAAAIRGQGSLATQNAATWLTQVLGTGKPDSFATVGSIAGINLLEGIGAGVLPLNAIKTILGTAAGISGQSAWATFAALSPGGVSSKLSYLQADGAMKLGSANGILSEFGDFWITNANSVTSLGTAAAIAGQGAFATVNSAGLGSALLTGFGPLAATDRVRLGISGGMVDEANSYWLTTSTVVTSAGQAASIIGQGFLATNYPARLTGHPDHGDSYLRADLLAFSAASGGNTIQGLKPAEPSANVTENRAAAAIAGQGAFATQNNLSVDNGAFFTLPARMAASDHGPTWFRADRVAWAAGDVVENLKPGEASANRTETRTAAAIAGQGGFATLSSVHLGNVASYFNYNAFSLNYTLTRQDGNTILTESLAITALGISAGFVGQGTLATANVVDYATQVTNKPTAGQAKMTKTFTAAPSSVIEIMVDVGANVALEFSWRGQNFSVGGDRTGRIRVRAAGTGGYSDALVGVPTYVGPDGPGFDQATGSWTNTTGLKQVFEFRFEMVGSAVTYTPISLNFFAVG